jgi:hypothetical protein
MTTRFRLLLVLGLSTSCTVLAHYLLTILQELL